MKKVKLSTIVKGVLLLNLFGVLVLLGGCKDKGKELGNSDEQSEDIQVEEQDMSDMGEVVEIITKEDNIDAVGVNDLNTLSEDQQEAVKEAVEVLRTHFRTFNEKDLDGHLDTVTDLYLELKQTSKENLFSKHDVKQRFASNIDVVGVSDDLSIIELYTLKDVYVSSKEQGFEGVRMSVIYSIEKEDNYYKITSETPDFTEIQEINSQFEVIEK